MKIAILETSLRDASISKMAGEVAAHAIQQAGHTPLIISQATIGRIPLYGSASASTDNKFPDIQDAIRATLMEADAIIWCVPVHCAGASGVARNFLEYFGSSLQGKWQTILCSGGSQASVLAPRDFLSSLAIECNSPVLPRWVFVTEADKAGNELGSKACEKVQLSVNQLLKCVELMPLLP